MELFFRKYGYGKSIIILHGLYGISDNWVNYARKLSENFSIYIPDLRNHGHSGHSMHFNYDVMVEDIVEFIEKNEIENPILIGHSMGGKVAMKFVLNNPNMVSKLVVIDMSARNYHLRSIHSNIINAMLDIDFLKIKSRKEVDAFLSKFIEDNRIRQFVMKNLHRTEKKSFSWRINLQAIIDNLDLLFEEIINQGNFTGKTLFIKGEKSDYINDEDYLEMKKYFPNSNIITISNAGHWVQVDNPDDFFNALQNFLVEK